VRPSEFPPSFDAREFVAAPSDPEDERIEVGILIVGAGPAGLACAIRLGQLLEGAPELAARLGDVPVAVVRAGGEVFALHDVCSHEEVPLSEGDIYDHTVECYLHGSCFDLRTGKPTGPPATRPVPVYRVKIEGDDVYVALGEDRADDQSG